MNLVAYLRVSTDGQVDGYGLTVQRQDVERWAERHGHRIVHWCVDEGVSGTVDATDRPGLACALDAVHSGDVRGLLTPKLDRLARSLTVQEAALAHIWRDGGRVFTAEQGEIAADDKTDPMRTAMRQVAGVFAQLERAMIAERLRKGRAAKTEAGGYGGHGSPPFGWRSENATLVPDEREQAIIQRVLELRDRGQSTRAIVAVLDAEGHRTKRGQSFSPMTVARIVKRAAVNA